METVQVPQEPTREILIERLAAHRLAGPIPREEKEWLAANGHLRRLATGDILTSRAAGVVEGLFIVLSGHIGLFVDRANGREKIMEWRAGDVAGLLPYSRLVVPPGDSSAQEPSEIIVIRRDDIPALIRECHAFTSALVHVMVDRARHFTSSDLHAEKMASLGKLAAGLAHELNNPAAAIVRSARSLEGAISATENASRELGCLSLTPEQFAAIDGVRVQAMQPSAAGLRSPLEQADHEAAMEDWLSDHGADVRHAAALGEAGITPETLDQIVGSLQGPHLNIAVAWLAAGSLARQLTNEITTAASRISSLVEAVKGFTHMDQHASAAPVDIAKGLAQTLAIMNGKARAKAVAVRVDIDPALPQPCGVPGELNQIWANLIDNALDAAPQSGTVMVTANSEGQHVVVRVTDDGPGIPSEIKQRIFDPFFTTKKVGQGTGLGLDIVKRIISKHRGSISVESQPGRTQFSVALPLVSAAAGQEK
jgi:signal transduction histidine kinase